MTSYVETGQLDPVWTFETAVSEISARWRPGGISSGATRNRLLESWGQLVGGERAASEVRECMVRHGSKTAAARWLRMTPSTLSELLSYYESLPTRSGGGLHAGKVVSHWVLQKRLGQGGNAEVWRAQSERFGECALKLPNSRRVFSEPYRRFQAEVELLTMLGHRRGILPSISGYAPLSLGEGERAWLALPIATPIAETIVGDQRLHAVGAGMHAIASTLTKLHAEGVQHRDLKPENILLWRGEWVLSDFGLANFPGKQVHTTDAKKLGSTHYLAPEMLNAPASADAAAADVYALAKTFWVLATGQNYPLPGVQPAEGFGSLSHWLGSDVVALDSLLHAATNLEPCRRPAMEHVARALGEMMVSRM